MPPARRPDLPRTTGAVMLHADLDVEIGSGGQVTHARLRDGDAGLVLDVDDVAIALRSLPERPVLRRLLRDPLRWGMTPLRGQRLTVRSGGHALALLRVDEDGRIRAVPTPAGVGALLRFGSGTRRGSLALTVVGAAAVAASAVVAALLAWRSRHQG